MSLPFGSWNLGIFHVFWKLLRHQRGIIWQGWVTKNQLMTWEVKTCVDEVRYVVKSRSNWYAKLIVDWIGQSGIQIWWWDKNLIRSRQVYPIQFRDENLNKGMSSWAHGLHGPHGIIMRLIPDRGPHPTRAVARGVHPNRGGQGSPFLLSNNFIVSDSEDLKIRANQ